MTIPQLLSYIGWPVFGFGVAFLVLHTVNLMIPGIDFMIHSTRSPIVIYVISAIAIVFGGISGLAGFFGEQLHEAWLKRLEERDLGIRR